ncbi:MAG: hypothetical protein OHM56_09570 [Spiroplasma phoeniceum]|nr:MAG: hypothetical protein OHM57_08970 [Spiroplasma phoeniceum]UZQ31836.1 MAG: hypothetical protein OHM56_09570 [Spiroplasma phoeniceum]
MLIANNGYDKATILKYSAHSNVEIDDALYSKYLKRWIAKYLSSGFNCATISGRGAYFGVVVKLMIS